MNKGLGYLRGSNSSGSASSEIERQRVRVSKKYNKSGSANLLKKSCLLRVSRTSSCVFRHQMLQGTLRKQERGILKRFKKRWFTVGADFILRYYASSQSGNVLGEIEVGNIIDVRYLNEDHKGHKECPFGFQITTSERAYYLFAETNEERRKWCDGLNIKIEQLKKLKSKPCLHTLSQPLTPFQRFSLTNSTNSYARSRSQTFTAKDILNNTQNNANGNVVVVSADSASCVPQHQQQHQQHQQQHPAHNNENNAPTIFSLDTYSPLRQTHRNQTSPPNLISHNQTISHARQKSNGRVKEDVNEYVMMSMWLQQQAKEKGHKDALDRVMMENERRHSVKQDGGEGQHKDISLLRALRRVSSGMINETPKK